MNPWNHETQQFDPPHDWPIEPLDPHDHDVGRGLVLGVILGVAVWTLLVVSWRFPAIRRAEVGVLEVLAVVGFMFVALYVSRRITDNWRANHPDNSVVDWLRRNGL